MTVLIGDDYAPLRASVRAVLESSGYQVDEAEDGNAVLERLRQEDVDVLILDMHMPDCDGPEVLRRFGGPPPAVVVLSAFELVSGPAVEQEFRTRVFRFLKKPVSPVELLDAVAGAAAAGGSGPA